MFRASARFDTAVTFSSPNVTWPASGFLNAASACSNVDLPLPLRPSTAHISPGLKPIERPSTSVRPG